MAVTITSDVLVHGVELTGEGADLVEATESLLNAAHEYLDPMKPTVLLASDGSASYTRVSMYVGGAWECKSLSALWPYRVDLRDILLNAHENFHTVIPGNSEKE